jgi:hypothetical protein
MEGLLIKHKTFGTGTVTKFDGKFLTVAFANKVSAFQYPAAFTSFIQAADPTVQAVILQEIENAKAAIPLVRRDSMLGYEPSMLYQTDEKAILWKIKQVNYMIDVELDMYRKGAKY